MFSPVRGGGLPAGALACGLAIWAFSGPPAMAQGGLGPSPGFQGFGLGYHLGYGYGGNALGVGPFGGFPFYGGPGYPCVEPRLRRFGRIVPFPYNPGAGYPTPDHPNYFLGEVGPLVADTPVITLGSDRGDSSYATGYGQFTGAFPDPEARFAPFTKAAAASGTTGGSSGGANPNYPAQPSGSLPPAPGSGPPMTPFGGPGPVAPGFAPTQTPALSPR